MGNHTINQVIRSLPNQTGSRLPAPPYVATPGIVTSNRVGLAVESMCRHMTDEGWQLFAGLAHAGYALAGRDLPVNTVKIPEILERTNPGTLVVQDKREWDLARGDFRDPAARFMGIDQLKSRNDIFKLTILKDAHQRPEYHRQAADEMGAHAWIIYYHPSIVCRLAPYVRPMHLIRTYHTVDATCVPPCAIADTRSGCLLSGAIGSAYPLRTRLVQQVRHLPDCTYLAHPGYHRRGSETPRFLRILSRYKVAVCTASRYGYALRKLIEATACGCIVITDLPGDEVLPHIDGNLVRIPPDIHPRALGNVIKHLLASYDPVRQEYYARLALQYYDYRVMGARLAADIETVRQVYNGPTREAE